MGLTKKFDRAFQWGCEKMGAEARTTHSDDFKALEAEMLLRQDGMERIQKHSNIYIKSIARRTEAYEDKDRILPNALFGRTLATHGADFAEDSVFGNCLASLGHANERLADYQQSYAAQTTTSWQEYVDHNVTTMKEYSAARKKLENRRLVYDASTAKMAKAKRDDVRVEEEVRINRAKYEESGEDVLRRMQDIREAEAESINALTMLMNAELEFYERCAEEMRRVRDSWVAGVDVMPSAPPSPVQRQPTQPIISSRLTTTRQPTMSEETTIRRTTSRKSSISSGSRAPPPPPPASRPGVVRASTADISVANRFTPHVQPPLARVSTDTGAYRTARQEDVFRDDVSTESSTGSPNSGFRSLSPATSYGSLSQSTAALANRKPPPPPVNRANKPAPPPVPASRKENVSFRHA